MRGGGADFRGGGQTQNLVWFTFPPESASSAVGSETRAADVKKLVRHKSGCEKESRCLLGVIGIITA